MEELYCGHLNEVFNTTGPEYLYLEEHEEDIFQRPSLPGAFSGQSHTEESKVLMRGPKTEEHKDRIRQGILNSDRAHIYEANRQRMLGTTQTKETRKKIGDACRESYMVTYNDGRTETISGIGKWCKKNKYSTNGVYSLLKGEWKKHKDLVRIEKLNNTHRAEE